MCVVLMRGCDDTHKYYSGYGVLSVQRPRANGCRQGEQIGMNLCSARAHSVSLTLFGRPAQDIATRAGRPTDFVSEKVLFSSKQ